ncbi:MAG: UvrD-helicase domain-containing protein [Candidatus Kapabacteria bacterium]|nr:UvrD-helicase domain-containing protein [Candidatus Kapabacteria bacterium]
MMQFHEEQQAALDLTVHCAVHANAGSGKTSVLTHRFLKILIETNTTMDQIVAITFTRASAAEMRERVHSRLVTLLHDPVERGAFATTLSDEILCSHIRRWINEVGQSRISTFHSFCSSIIRQYAEDLDLDADVRDLEENEARVLSAEAVQDALRAALEPQGPLHDEALALFDDVSIASATEIISRLARSHSFVTDVLHRVDVDSSLYCEKQHALVMSMLKGLAADLLEAAAECLSAYTIYPMYNKAVNELGGLRDQLATLEPPLAVDRTVATIEYWFTDKGEFRSVHNKASVVSRARDAIALHRTAISAYRHGGIGRLFGKETRA